MKDGYHILGVSRHASPGEIRAAFLARMKVCHPDAGRDPANGEAAEISQAYWQLRDAHRRAEHDRALFGAPVAVARPPRGRKVSLAKPPATRRRPARSVAPVGAKSTRRRPRSRRLEPLRAAAGVAAFAIAIAGFAAAGTYFGGKGTPEAHAASASVPERPTKVRAATASRRTINSASAESAASEFRTVVARSGLAGAHQYARQCLMELTARPTMTMLDYCMAFDDQASAWERNASAQEREIRRYFAPDQRFGRYSSAARGLTPGPVRESMMADVSFFAETRD